MCVVSYKLLNNNINYTSRPVGFAHTFLLLGSSSFSFTLLCGRFIREIHELK